MDKNILVIAPHPDDETLGCGGSILKHKANGDNIYWLIVTNILENQGWKKERVEERNNEIKKVSQTYCFDKYFNLELPTTKLDEISFGLIIEKVSKIIKLISPHTIYVNHGTDIHTDHKIVFQAVMSCTKNFRYPFIKRILTYETLSETEFSPALNQYVFIPNVFVDITEYFQRKIEIMKIYESEIMEDNLPRSISTIESLARYRGSRIGKKYAESFQLIFQDGIL